MHVRRYRLLLSLIFVLTVLVTPNFLSAQNETIISVAIPEYMSDIFNNALFTDFEAANPGVKVNLVKSGMQSYISPAGAVEEHLDGVADYVSTADVLYVNSFTFAPESTRAGYILDLTPLVSADTTLNPEDFLPAVWESYQWDGGIWALPVAASVNFLAYQPDKFDEAGIPYPNASWTIDDFTDAIRRLAETDANGNVTVPGFAAFSNVGLLFRALLGQGFYDNTILPNPPLFNNADLENLLTQWSELDKDGYTGSNISFGTFDFNDIPMRLDQSYLLSPFASNERNWDAALLPGGIAGLNVDAFAVSGGTSYPEQAYALAKYLTSNIEVVSRFFSDTPARQSLVGVESEDSVQISLNYAPEDAAFIQDALANAVPMSELRFSEYITIALSSMSGEGQDVRTALQEAETLAIENLQAGESRRGATSIFVATPEPTPILTAGEVGIKFGLTAFFSPLPNREAWDQTIDDFTATDPQVRQIVFDNGFSTQLSQLATQYDCFYLPYNIVPSTEDLSSLLSLDPFMGIDPNFDKSDVVGTTLTQLQKDGKTWGYPITIQPQVMRYHSELFEQAGVPTPETTWTIDDFRDALEQLKANSETPEQPPFIPSNFGGTYLLLLMSAYGGIPVDYRTTPPTINYSDPAIVEAMRQVLNLAKDGYIRYTQLGNFSGGTGFGGSHIPITDESLNGSNLFRFSGGTSGENTDPYRMALYPTGNQFNGISYDIGAGYISANAQNPDACYRWLSTIAARPDLFGAMPARRSLFNATEALGPGGEQAAEIYAQIDALLQDPNTVAFPSPFGAAGSPGDFVMQLWLYRAFDNYVLEDGDLDAKLAEAETFTQAYQECVANIPPNTLPPDASQQEQLEYFRQYTDCAVDIDPSLNSLFGILGGS